MIHIKTNSNPEPEQEKPKKLGFLNRILVLFFLFISITWIASSVRACMALREDGYPSIEIIPIYKPVQQDAPATQEEQPSQPTNTSTES